MGNCLRRGGFRAIPDQYNTFSELQQALRQNGVETAELMLAVDFTKSNMWSGDKSFGMPMHTLGTPQGNPYERAIRAVGQTMVGMGGSGDIHSFGFGDATTTDRSVFAFKSDGSPCRSFEEVLREYQRIVPLVTLAGPTSITPILRAACDIVRQSARYTILVIIGDGALDDVVADGEAVVQASKLPLSVVFIGVGDGPWEAMHEFDDGLPKRLFDNFQFVCQSEVERKRCERPDLYFATCALQEIPMQYAAVKRLGLLRQARAAADASAGSAPGPLGVPGPARL